MLALLLILISPAFALAKPFLIETTTGNDIIYGRGFFIESNGIALTSNHVVENAHLIKANIEGKNYIASIISYDEVLDIALIQVEQNIKNTNFDNIYKISTCNDIQNGSIILQSEKVNTSIVSNEENKYILNASVKRGYSGSPFTSKGNVCGVLTGFHKETKNAIVAKLQESKLEEMLQGQSFLKKDLQIYMASLDKNTMITLGLNLKQNPHGILVTYSANTLIHTWDVVTKINNTPIHTVNEALSTLSEIYNLQQVEITIIRNGETVILTV